jgi:hypothetical protein
MKQWLLVTLLLIWCAITVELGLQNLDFQDRSQMDLQHRAFIVYYHTFAGCLWGLEIAGKKWFTEYDACRTLAFKEKEAYLK